jgi:hypothetical protein
VKAQYHPNSKDAEEVEVLDIFVDGDGQPKMLFVRSDGHVHTAPIGRFTELLNGSEPVKKARRRDTGEGPEIP